MLAQPAIDNTYLPVTGNKFSGKSFELTHSLPIGVGPNQTWDFSQIDSVYTDTVRFKVIAPGASANGASFSGATKTVVRTNSIQTIEFFYKEQSGHLQDMGYQPVGSQEKEVFSDPRLEIRDMVFQDAFLELGESVRHFFGVDRFVRYEDTLFYAGFGTLITPEGTHTNVPLIQRNTGVSISETAGGTYALAELYKRWEWYLPGYGIPYMRYGEEIYDYSIPEFAVTNYLGYVGFIEPVSVKPDAKAFQTLHTSPNPARKLASIELQGISVGQRSQLQWMDMQGRVVARSENVGKRCAVPELEPGIYTLLMETESNLFRTRVVVE